MILLQQLVSNAPPWFTCNSHTLAEIRGLAYPSGTGWSNSGIELAIRLKAGEIRASELSPGTCLPKSCPERHIESDGKFCLGLNPIWPDGPQEAALWWAHLLQYLHCQQTAVKVGIWSMHHARDHGKAGEFQNEAIKLADELGVSEEYELAYEGSPSWITDPSLHLVHKDGRQINGRSPCPRGCRWKKRPSRPVVRKDCKHRDTMCRLAFLERRRRAALDTFWNELKSTKAQCCGTMRDCPLRQQ